MSLFCFIRLLLSPVLLEISGNRFDWKYFHSWISFCLFWVFFFFFEICCEVFAVSLTQKQDEMKAIQIPCQGYKLQPGTGSKKKKNYMLPIPALAAS